MLEMNFYYVLEKAQFPYERSLHKVQPAQRRRDGNGNKIWNADNGLRLIIYNP